MAVSPPGIPAGLTAEQQATPLFDAGRNNFIQATIEPRWPRWIRPLRKCPMTPCFTSSAAWRCAMGRYKEAAAADYAVLSAGPRAGTGRP